MKGLTFLCILMIMVVAGCYLTNQKTTEGFISGTEVQLLTSKPYYTWYDYITNLRRYPYYYNYGTYPYYGGGYRYPYYNYGFSPYYRPRYY